MRFLLLLLFCLIGQSLAIYQDQAGNLDWYKKYVGLTEEGVIYTNKPRLCVQTASSLVSCLNLRDGDIIWRKSFLNQPKGIVVAESSNVVLTVSDGKLTALDNDGAYKWERKVAEDDVPLKMFPLLSDDKIVHSVLFVSGEKVQVFDSLDGNQLDSLESEGINKSVQHAFGDKKQAVVVAYEHGESVVSVLPIVKEAEAVNVVTSAPLSPLAAAAEEFLAILSVDKASLCIVTTSKDDAIVNCAALPAAAAAVAAAEDVSLRAAASGVVFFSKTQGKAALVKVDVVSYSDALSLTWSGAAEAISPLVASGETAFFAAVTSSSKGSLSVRVVDASSGAVLLAEDTPAPQIFERLAKHSPLPLPAGAAVGVFRRKDRSLGFRTAVFLDDGQILLLQQGQVVWRRDEALASMTAPPLFVDLPAPRAGAAALAVDAPAANLTERFRYQLLGAKMQIKIATPAEKREYRQLREKLSSVNLPVRDINGFRKLVLAITAAGKLTAFHNGDGRTIWTTIFAKEDAVKAQAQAQAHVSALSSVAATTTTKKRNGDKEDKEEGKEEAAVTPLPRPNRLLPWRTFHDVSHAPQVLLLRTETPLPYAATLNAHTGELLMRQDLGSAVVDQIVPIHEHLHDGTAEQSVYLLVSYANKAAVCGGDAATVRLVPDTSDTRAYVAKNFRKLFFWTQEADSALCGFGFTADAAEALASSPSAAGHHRHHLELHAVRTWHLPFAAPEAILATTVRDPSEPIPSSVKVWHDRTIKYKYVRPNVAFVAVGRRNGAALGADEDPMAVEMTTYLVDTVTGAVLYTQTHLGARGPVTAVLSENLLVYTFWDMTSARFTVLTQELYDATPRGFSVLDYLFNPNSTRPTSSFAPAPIEAIGQVFLLPLQPRRLYATATRQGYTMKQVLVETNTDQIYLLDRRFLNPRRPKKQKLSQEEMEDGLVPYQEILPFIASHFLTLDKTVLGLSAASPPSLAASAVGAGQTADASPSLAPVASGVSVVPAYLESTCHVVAHGVDVFYTRMRPAMAFDSLDDDFSYALLVVALLVLGAGSFALSHITRRTVLKQKWK